LSYVYSPWSTLMESRLQ